MSKAPEKIVLTPQETTQLAQIVREAVTAQLRIWDLLTKIGERIGAEWEPSFETGASSDIVDYLASGCSDAEDVAQDLTEAAVAECFIQGEDWEFAEPDEIGFRPHVESQEHPDTDEHRAGCTHCQYVHDKALPDGGAE